MVNQMIDNTVNIIRDKYKTKDTLGNTFRKLQNFFVPNIPNLLLGDIRYDIVLTSSQDFYGMIKTLFKRLPA